MPDGAPAVVSCRSGRAGAAVQSVHDVRGLLDEVERTAIALYPRWLPGAARIAGPQGAGIAAVRAIAAETAATSGHYGPFLADLAERALRARRGIAPGADRFSVQVRAVALARVIAASYQRPTAALVIEMPAALSEHDERSLTAAAEWIAYHGAWVVAMVETSPRTSVSIPSGTPTEGVPRPDSPAELALEAALRTQPWARGRVWNRTYQSGPLTPGYRLDLWWEAECCVVEIDGPEHRSAERYAADRRRDVQLQLEGQSVLRFTNDHVLADVSDVVSQIERLVRSRRPQPAAFGESPTCQPTAHCPS